MEPNYRRNIPNEQEHWVHTPLIPRPLRLIRYTHTLRCRNGLQPHCCECIVGKHQTPTHTIWVIRNTHLQLLQWPPEHRDGDFD